jgi:methionine synthase II (cobalamin-independent)
VSTSLEVRSTGIGSWPGQDMAQALKITFAESPDLPYLPELPARGEHAGMIGRATALLSGLAVDLQPAGWRLTGASGRDHRMARSTLREDLDLLEEMAQGYVGPIKYSVAGPWTLAAMVERPRGDRVVADPGARRDLSQSLAEGLLQLVGEMSRRLPDSTALVQLDEPMIPAVYAGSVHTASGLSTHRPVDRAELSGAVGYIVDQLGPEVPVLVHCCARGLPIGLMQAAGVQGVFVDVDQLVTSDWDLIGEGFEKGQWFGAGAAPTGANPSADQVAERVLRPVRALDVDPAVAGQLIITPACGLAGLDPAAALQVLRTVRTAAGIVTEELAE